MRMDSKICHQYCQLCINKHAEIHMEIESGILNELKPRMTFWKLLYVACVISK